MKRIGLVSLGCAKNLVDSEMMLAMFPKEKFEITNDPSNADIIIVNTCGFITSAKEESINTIFDMLSYGSKVIITGCLAERYYDELIKEIPEAAAIVRIASYATLHKVFEEVCEEDGIAPMNPLRRVISTKPFSAYLRISEGCNNFCSFCAIPLIRGRFVSRPYEEILEEARDLYAKGVKEVSLISQDTTIYGSDFKEKKPDICDLLRALEAIGFYSIRLLYLYPSEISDELIDLIAGSKQIAHYFDIPVQCASDHLLKLMRRHADATETRLLFKKIKEKCPDAILRTTLIAGFPGENEDDQKETIDFLEEIQFDHMGCFVYSREEGTRGYDLPDQVDEEIKEKRRDELMKLQRKISRARAKAQIGKVYEGLIVDYDPNKKQYLFRCTWNAPDDVDGAIYVSSNRCLKEGDIVKVKITNAFIYDLMGEVIG